ncbi:MAG: metallophosphoesterase [Terriglobia bacterium]|jgi:predicted MPP superfamily phosphohydrolase
MLQGLLIASAGVLILVASQVFWVKQFRRWATSLIPSSAWRRRILVAVLVAYVLVLSYNLLPSWIVFILNRISMIGERAGSTGAADLTMRGALHQAHFWGWIRGAARSTEPTHLTLRAALLQAPFQWWIFCSLLGFLIAVLLGLGDRIARGARWLYRRVARAGSGVPLPSRVSLARRRFLERAAVAMSTAPFVAGAYGMFYERLNLEISHQRIKIPRLPRAFEGFRIAQLSDIHIGAFMPADEIRRYVGIANGLKPDLVALTGDFVTWDPSTQSAVVDVLAGIKAPFGVYGCLGNHEMWAKVEDSITSLFAAHGIRILRHERALIASGNEFINLLGVDYESRSPRMGPDRPHAVREYLLGVDGLIAPGTANILLSHNPNTFDRAAEYGIDLSLAGHTHGGQVTLEFISPDLSPSRLITSYIRGWFEKPGGQLYVNRGIGTIGVPIRFDAPPEITVFELARS